MYTLNTKPNWIKESIKEKSKNPPVKNKLRLL